MNAISNQAQLERPASGLAHFLTLDGLRGFAAILVLLYHRRLWAGEQILGHGYLAVDFFFVLSGFVIAYAYEDRLAHRTMSIARFAQLRFIRLTPLLLVGTLMGCAMFAWHALDLHWVGGVFRGILAVPLAIIPLPLPRQLIFNPWPLDGPAWSLFFELSANFAFALLVRQLVGWRLPVLVALSAVALTAIVIGQRTASIGQNWETFGYGFVRVAFPFLTGVLLLRMKRAGRLHLSLPVWPLLALLLAVMVAPPLPGVWNGIFDMAAILLVFPFVVAAASGHEPAARWQPLVMWSAAISYPVYVLHYPMLDLMERLLEPTGLPHIVLFALILPIVLPIAWAAGVAYDEPVRAWLRTKTRASLAARPARPERPAGRALPITPDTTLVD